MTTNPLSPTTRTPLARTPLTRTWLLTSGPRALVTALAGAVLDDGGALVLATADPVLRTAFAAAAARAPHRVRSVALDVREPAAAEEAVRTAVDGFGRLDVVVTAGAASSTGGSAPGDVPARVEAELLRAVPLVQAALPVLRRQRSGHLLHLASPGGPAAAAPGAAAALAARRAVDGWLEALHEEVAADGVRVTTAQPGGEPGDPHRTARVLADLPDLAHPPLRLVLGAEALGWARQAARARVQELEVWEEVSRATGRAGAAAGFPDRRLSPVLHLAAPAA